MVGEITERMLHYPRSAGAVVLTGDILDVNSTGLRPAPIDLWSLKSSTHHFVKFNMPEKSNIPQIAFCYRSFDSANSVTREAT